MRLLLLAALVVLVLIVVAWAARRARGRPAISGLWRGEEDFLDEAGLSDFYLYIAPPDGATGKSSGYLFMADADGEVVCDEAIDVAAAARLLDPRRLTLGIEYPLAAAGGGEEALPGDLEGEVDAGRGTLKLTRGRELYGFLVRDNAASLAADAEYGADR